MSATEFTPERSDAIRSLLLDTVADEPRRRRRFQIALTSILAAIAIVLAGGTAALAMSGIIRFDAPPPAPVVTDAPSVTPTPTPTPTAAPTAPAAAIQVQSTPITPTDVRSLPAHPSWSLDLPAATSDCQQRFGYNIATGLALFTLSSNATDVGRGCVAGHGTASVTMVDTVHGTVLWSREWNWDGDTGRGTSLAVLGTSNRALFADTSGGGGPRDILDLATGRTVATLPADFGPDPLNRLSPVWDDSGDVIWTKPTTLDASGQPTAYTVERVDPRDLAHPSWETPLQASDAGMMLRNFSGSGLAQLAYVPDGGGAWMTSLIDLGTGAISHVSPNGTQMALGSVIIEYRDLVDGYPHTIAAIDRSTGETLWTKPFSRDDNIAEATTTNGQPGDVAGGAIGSTGFGFGTPSGDLVMTNTTTLTRIDSTTGAVLMTADITRCGLTPGGLVSRDILADTERNSLVVVDKATCSVDRDTGAATPIVDPPGSSQYFGPGVTYQNGATINAPGTGAAYDRATGAQLWTTATATDEQWYFAGGVLVRQDGNHLSSLG